MIKKLLLASGILAAIAVFIPSSVVLGLYLGIIPGLILAVAPTLFLYTAGFTVLRLRLRQRWPLRAGRALDAGAAVLTVAIGVLLTAPAALAGRFALAATTRDDVSATGTVQLEGNVRLQRSGRSWYAVGNPKDGCDALCAALLDTPGVRSVTIDGRDSSGKSFSPVTYRLIPKREARSTTLMPIEPARIVDQLPAIDRGRTAGRDGWKEAIDAKKMLQNSVTAEWSLRLADAESLVAEPPPTTFDHTIVIRDEPQRGIHRIAVTEVEIADREGKVLLRQQRVTAALIAMPFHVTPGGPMLERGFEVGRRSFHTGPRYFDFRPVETLFRETTLARPAADERAAGRLRDALMASDAGAPAEPAVLVAPWLATLDWQHLDEKDVDVLAKLIADPGRTGLERLYDGHAEKVPARLRRPIAIRLLDASTDDRLRATLNRLVWNMPAGTYAELLPEEQSLLRDRGLRLRSSALVARLSDQGAEAVPLLLRLLTEDVEVKPWARRQWILADIRRAFSRLGRDAASALPTVEHLFALPGSPLTNSSNDIDNWRTAMVRMGKPVETLTFPSHMSAEAVARERKQIRTQAEKGPER